VQIILAIMIGLIFPYLLRVIFGPSVWDRLLAMNLITAKVIMIIISFASIYDMSFMLDFAIIYALSGFIGAIFLALFLSQRDLKKRRGGENP